ncbi:MAG: hypothetical protein Athens071426_455, partial [Parcubacteria group bacterium Athens0714_26]
MDLFITISSLAAAALIVGTVIFFVTKKIRRKYFFETLELKLLLVKLRKNSNLKNEEWQKEINLFSQLAGILSNLKIPVSFEMAVHYIGESILFYVAVPRKSVQFAMKQIQSFWSDSQVEEIDDYNIFNSQGQISAVYLKQKQNSILPIRTFDEAGLDTFLPILSDFSKIEAVGEGAAMQILIKPASISFKKNLEGVIHRLKKGEKIEKILAGNSISINDIQSALSDNKEKSDADKPFLDEELIKAIEKKLAKPLFSVNARLVASAPSSFRAEEILNNIIGSFDQFAAPLRNSFKAIKPKKADELVFKFIFRQFDNSQEMILGSDELSSLIHFPTSLTEIPRIKWVKTREAPPPQILAKEGVLIGKSVFRNEEKNIFIGDDDRRRHVYLMGQTGTGKSNLMANMAIDDIKAGKGVAVIDPHGDLIDLILGLIPENRKNDVIVFDPSDLQKPVGLNMLEYDFSRPEEKTFIINEIQSIFNKLFPPETMGPMFEQYMRNALILLMEGAIFEPATLMDVPKVFTDSNFRAVKLAQCQNPAVKDFWEKEAVMAAGEGSLQNITPYITSKFSNFIANDYVRPIINQAKSAFKFREVIDEGKILLINLSKGRIGDINAGLLGMITVGKLLMAALSRVDTEQEKRKDFYLYIDEFQNFTTDSIAVILSEARKYRLDLVIANQFVAQLTEKIRNSVFGNVGSIIAFRVGSDDAELLEKQFMPIFSKEDLINMDNFNAAVKLLIEGQASKPFNIKTLMSPRGNTESQQQ